MTEKVYRSSTPDLEYPEPRIRKVKNNSMTETIDLILK